MITWDNLWKWACFTPGTVYPRVTLAVWQFGLMAGPLVGYWWADHAWWGAVAGGVGAFFLHELVFHAYVRWVVRVSMMDDGDIVGSSSRADYTFERWIGPVC